MPRPEQPVLAVPPQGALLPAPGAQSQAIARVVAKWTGIPVTQMMETEQEKLLHMEDRLRERIKGQEEAIHAISDAIRRARSGLKDPRRPIGSFIFIGPSGVGKDSVLRGLKEQGLPFRFVPTMNTRPRRPDEVDGVLWDPMPGGSGPLTRPAARGRLPIPSRLIRNISCSLLHGTATRGYWLLEAKYPATVVPRPRAFTIYR